MADKIICTQCGRKLPSGRLDDRCPQCLLLNALEESPEEAPGAWPRALSGGAKIFGDFELLEEIAQGGMGKVYKARQISLNRTVAVKMILAGGLASPDAIRRFRAEAEHAARLQHPNIVAIHEVGECEGHHFFSMDYVDGPNLAALVRDHPLPARRAAGYLKTIAEAVHYAHQQGVLHRDLKPSNVLIDPFDQPRITDFGLAKRIISESVGTRSTASHSSSDAVGKVLGRPPTRAEDDPTLSGQVIGSPNFMPPEQAEGRHSEVGPTSDVYALGALFYHLLTGRPPFQAETLTSLLKQVVEADPVAPRLLNPSIPKDLETIGLKCLEKEPAKRYASAQALAEDLGRFLHGEAVLARPVGAVDKAWRWCRRKPAIASLLAGLVLVIAVGLTGVLWQWRRAEQQRANAQANELLARQNELFARQNAYAADMNLAHQALKEHDLGRALELLNRYRPETKAEGSTQNSKLNTQHSEIDLRGWEWRYLWKLCQNDEQFTLCQYTNMIGALALSSDGKWLAVRHRGYLALWDLAARREVAVWPCSDCRRALAFTPDGKYVAAGYASTGTTTQKFVGLWDVPTGREAATLAHKGDVVFLAFSPDGKLATYESTGTIRLWNVENQELVATNMASSQPLIQRTGYGWDDARGTLAFSPDGTVLAIGEAGDSSGQIQLWEWAAGKRRTIPAPMATDGVTTLAFSPDGTLLAAGYGYADANIYLWNVNDLTNVAKLEGHKAWISALAFAREGKLLLSASGDQTLRLWDVPQRKALRSLQGHIQEVWAAVVSPDGTQIVSGGKDGSIRVWDTVTTSTKTAVVTLPEPIGWLGQMFAPDNRTLYSVTDFGTRTPLSVKAWDLETGQEKRQFPALGTNNLCVAVSPNGRLLVAGKRNGRVQVWDLVDDHAVTNFVACTNMMVVGLTFDRHTQQLLTLGWNWSTTRVARWEVPAWRRLSSDLTISTPGLSYDVSPDFCRIATGQVHGGVSVWDLTTGQKWAEFPGNLPTVVKAVAFLDGGAVLAAGGQDGLIRLYDVNQRRELATFRGQMSAVHSLAVSPDGRRLASGGTRPSEAVRLWDVATRKDLLNLECQGSLFGFTGFSPDGNILVASNGKMLMHVWRAPSWAEIEAAEKR